MKNEIKRKEFVISLPDNCRKRHSHSRINNKVVEFKVQLEVFVRSKWHPIVRYDTAHGFAHRDIIHFNGTIEKTPLFIDNYNEALDFADADIRINWQVYLRRFIEEATHDVR